MTFSEKFPSVEIAYEFIRTSPIFNQIDRSWEKTDDLFFRLIALSSPLAVSMPLLYKYFKVIGNPYLMYLGLLGFVIVVILCVIGRFRLSEKKTLNPLKIHQDYLTLSPEKFKADMIQDLGKCYEINKEMITKKRKFLNASAFTLCLQVIVFALWVSTSSSEDRPSSSQPQEPHMAKKQSQSQQPDPSQERQSQRPGGQSQQPDPSQERQSQRPRDEILNKESPPESGGSAIDSVDEKQQ